MSNKVPLVPSLFLTPDGEITCSVILFHSESLDINVWVVTQPIPFNAAQLRHKYFVFFSIRQEEGRLERKGPDTSLIHCHVGCGFGAIPGPVRVSGGRVSGGRVTALHMDVKHAATQGP